VDRYVGALAFSPDGQFLAIDTGGGGTVIWSLSARRIVAHLEIGLPGLAGTQLVQFSPDSRYLAVCGFAGEGRSDYSIFIYQTKTWKVAHEIASQTVGGLETGQPCSDVMFSADGKYLVRVDGPLHEFAVLLYDTSNWRVVRALRTTPLKKDMTPTDPAVRIVRDTHANTDSFGFYQGQPSLSINGRYLALPGTALARPPPEERAHLDPVQIVQRTRGVAEVWILEMPAGNLLQSIDTEAYSLSWRPDGQRLAAGGGGKIELIDPHSGAIAVIQNSQLHPTGFGSAQGTEYGRELVAYSPDGRFLVEAMDRQVEIWDGNHGKLLQTIHAVPECLAISPDSRFVALGGSEVSMFDSVPLLDLAIHPHGSAGKVVLYEFK
jgi:WD40 repeat protein